MNDNVYFVFFRSPNRKWIKSGQFEWKNGGNQNKEGMQILNRRRNKGPLKNY